MKFEVWTTGAALIAAIVTTAAPARADGPPGNLPKWCAGINGQTETAAGFIEDEAKNTGYGTDRVARAIALGSCAWRSSAESTQKIRNQVAAGRAKFIAATGLSEAETDEMLALVVDKKRAEADNDAFCKAIKVDEGDVTRHELSESKARRFLVCDQGYGGGEYDWPDITQIEQVAQVNNCLRSVAGNFNKDTDKFAQQPWPMLQFATCNAVANRIDPKKFIAEVAADKRFNRYAALWAKATLGDTMQRIAVARERYKKIGAKKPALEELLFTAPEQGYAAFMTLYTANKAVIDKAAVLLAGGNKLKQLAKTYAGCSAEFEPLFVKAIGDKRPADADGFKAAFRDTFIHYTGLAFATCEAIDGHDLVADIYASRILGTSAAAGPMDAARSAALEVLFANADEIDGVRDMTVQRGAPTARLKVSAPASKETQAVIATVAPAKDNMVKVTFKKETWVEQLLNCKETNRIDRISDDGKIIYREICTPAGTKKRELKEEPVLVEKRFADALKPGRFLEMRVTTGADRVALPLMVYATKDKKQLSGYLGFAL
jgi:hypothetical protein